MIFSYIKSIGWYAGLCITVLLLPTVINGQISKQPVQSWNTKQSSKFTENKGHVTDQHGNLRPDVKYIYNAPGLKVIFKQNSFSYELYTIEKEPEQISESTGKQGKDDKLLPGKFSEPEKYTVKTHRIDITLSGSNSNPQILAEGKSSDYNNYYLAHTPENGIQKVNNFSKLSYKNVWNGIDIVFYAKKAGELKYDIVVHPGAKLSDIKFSYNGAGNINYTEGSIKIKTSLGYLDETVPGSYTVQDNKEVKISYGGGRNIISFSGQYDNSKTLVIDPVIHWATYYGGYYYDEVAGVKVDKAGNVYLGGYTASTSNIASTGAYQDTYGSSGSGYENAFIAKFDKYGKRLWGTYYGSGNNSMYTTSMAIDSACNIFITGYTQSTTVVATSGAHQTSNGGNEDAFLVKFDSAGILKWGTYYGGGMMDKSMDAACDKNGNVYIVGYTASSGSIATSGAHQTSLSGNWDVFLVKFDSTGARRWGTYYGGTISDERGYGVSCDIAGNIYITGYSDSKTGIATANGFQSSYSGSARRHAFLTKFNGAGKIIWGTYYAGDSREEGYAICTDKHCNVYLTGSTESYSGVATSGAFQTTHGDSGKSTYWYDIDAFLVKFDSACNRKWATYYGEDGQEWGASLDCDTAGNVYMSGHTRTSTNMYTPGAYQTKHGGGSEDAFLVKFNSRGKRKWATYFGGSSSDWSKSVSCDDSGNVYLAGSTSSTSSIATHSAHQTSSYNYSTDNDGFLVKFRPRDFTVDTLINVPKGICINDSFQFSAVVKNIYKKIDSNVYVTALFSGPESVKITDSLLHVPIPGYAKDTILFNSWAHFSAPGKYKLKVYIEPSDDSTENDTFVTQIIVHPIAITGFKHDVNCLDKSVRFIDTSKILSGKFTHYWDFGDSTYSTVANPVKKYFTTGTYNVKLVTTSGFGCKDSAIHQLVIDTAAPKNAITQFATVLSDTSIRLTVVKSVSIDVDMYLLYGSLNGGKFSLLDTFLNPDTTTFIWDHSNINTLKDKWCYYIISKKNCGNIYSVSSDTHCVMQLTGKPGNTTASLKWTSYEGLEVDKYIIERLEPTGKWNPIDSVKNNINTYNDTNLHCGIWYSYRISAKQKGGNYYNSYSDTLAIKPFDTIAPPTVNILYATVVGDTTIQLSFKSVPDKDVTTYTVYSSVNGGTYTKVATYIKPFTSIFTYSDITAKPLKNRYSFKVFASDSCGNISSTSETHQTIKLSGVAGNYSSILSWNDYTGFENNRIYVVQRKNASGWKNLAAIKDTLYLDSLLECQKGQTYRIKVIENSGDSQESFSNTITVTPFDTVKPIEPEIMFVSVVNGMPHLEWTNTSSDVRDYIIYRKNTSGKWDSIISVNDVDSFTDTSSDVSLSTYCYKILAIDSCAKNRSPLSKEHCTMLLKTTVNGCEKAINLKWSEYKGWNNIKSIELYRSKDQGTEILLDTISANATRYKDSGPDFHSTYCYRIKVYEKNGSNSYSWSNQSCNKTFFTDTAHIIFASKIVTSSTNGSIIIKWRNDAAMRYAASSRLYHSTTVNGPYLRTGKDIPAGTDSFVHTGINTQTGNHFYYLVNVDSCGTESDPSIVHKPIDLTVNIGQLTHNLSWTKYEGFDVMAYYVQRLENGTFRNTDTLKSNDTFLQKFPAPCNYSIFYRIAALDKDGRISYSDTMGRTAIDTIFANPATIHNLTVTGGNSTKLTYRGSDSLDVYAYTIQRSEDGAWETAGQVLFSTPGDTHVYADKIYTQSQQLCYTIITLDSCLNATMSKDTFCAIQLKGQELNLSNTLNWYGFKGYDIDKYSILKYNGSNWDTLGITSSDTNYLDKPLVCNVPETYKIAAVNLISNRFTLSDSIILIPFDTIAPPTPVMHFVTVQPDRSIKVSWSYNVLSDVKYFEVWRSKNGGPFNSIKTVVYDSVFTDINVAPQQNNYSYYVIAIDSCNKLNRSSASDTHNIINLKLSTGACDPEIRLSWTRYQNLENEIDGYEILRKTYTENDYSKISTVSFADTSFTDSTVTSGLYFYKIRAFDKKGMYDGYSDTVSLIPYQFSIPQPAKMLNATISRTGVSNGSIFLEWEKYFVPGDTFARGYKIYHRLNNGNFALLVKIYDINQSSYLHGGINTSDDLHEYYITVYNLCEKEGKASEVFRPVNLEIQNRNLEVAISWHPLKGDSVTKYLLYKLTDSLHILLTVNFTSADTSYLDFDVNCNKTYIYALTAYLANGKISHSDTVKIKAFDTIPPAKPDLYYVSVDTTLISAGKISMIWKCNNEPNRAGYKIYRSVNGAPRKLYVILNNTKPGEIFWEDVNINTKDNYYAYAISAIDSCEGNESLPSDTHRTVFLKTTAVSQYMQLNWHVYQGFKGCKYTVEKLEPNKAWRVLDTLNATVTSYRDSDVICHLFYNYRIRSIEDNSVWVSVSNTSGDTAIESVLPDAPVIVNATVAVTGDIGTGIIHVRWLPSKSNDTKYYNLYRSGDGINWTTLVENYSFLSWVDSKVNTKDSAYFYKLSSIDSCGNIGEYSGIHKTINLTATAGNSEMILNWTPYQGWDVIRYEIYRNGNEYANVSGNITNYIDSSVICTEAYQYLIKAISDSPEVWSFSNTDNNHFGNAIYDTKAPRTLYLHTASVSMPNKAVTLEWNASSNFDTRIYYVYKRSGINGRISLIDSTTALTYTEKQDTISVSDCYFVHAVDYCNNISQRSNRACLMILNGQSFREFHSISWNPYEVWQDGVKNYRIYKKEDDQNWKEIGFSDKTSFSDNFLNDTIVTHCYQVEAIENEGKDNATSLSTTICLHQDPIVYIPNAFTPDNSDLLNDYFGPKGINIRNYQMQIFNRWGQLIYETKSGKPWNGYFNDRAVAEGVYMYIFTVNSYNNHVTKQLKGTVTILK